MDAIVADGISKSFGDVEAVRDVSVRIDEGSVFALVGPNGAGKTTFIRCLVGTLTPDEGQVSLLGTPPESVDYGHVGLLPQDFSPPDRLTARELIEYYAGLYDEAQAVDSILDAVGIAGVADRRFVELSGGEQRRTLVGTGIVNDPNVLFLDEPTTGIDPAGRRDVWGLLESLAARGTTIFLTTHYMEEVERLADQIGVLNGGELVARDSPTDLVNEYGGSNRVLIDTTDTVGLEDYSVRETDDGVIIEGVAPDELGAIVSALAAAGVTYSGISWRAPDLETVYLSLTGEAPEDAAHEVPVGVES